MAPVIPVIAAAWTCVDSGSVVPVRLHLLTGWDEPMDGVLAVEVGVLQLAGRLLTLSIEPSLWAPMGLSQSTGETTKHEYDDQGRSSPEYKCY